MEKTKGKKIMGTKAGEITCGASFSMLPEGCIAKILSLTSPLDACSLSPVSPMFRLAAKSDFVWDRFLPSDYQAIISRSDRPLVFDSKKELYMHLCHVPILIDGGCKSFWIEKGSGKKCFMIAAKETLCPDVGDHNLLVELVNFSWISLPGSRFPEVALFQTTPPKITGKIKTHMLSPKTTYVAYLVFKVRNLYKSDYNAAMVAVGLLGCISAARTVYLNTDPWLPQQPFMPAGEERYPKKRKDEWYEIQLGEYFNEMGGEEELGMHLFTGRRPIDGLTVQGIEIRPKVGRE